mgnify:CR=1 FL=1
MPGARAAVVVFGCAQTLMTFSPTANLMITAQALSGAAGAVIAGKTNTPEWGAGANTRNAVYGVTGNPFDPSRSAAGSSGGSGVALATGMVPITGLA